MYCYSRPIESGINNGQSVRGVDTVVEKSLNDRRRAQTRREISDAALELFEINGFAGTTVDGIAARAGVSPRTVFRYFPTKEASILTITSEFVEAFTDAVADVESEDSALSRIEAAYQAVFERLVHDDPGALDRISRVRRLFANDPNLHAASSLFDSQVLEKMNNQLTTALAPGVDTTSSKLIVEIATATLRVAFDSWSATGESDPLEIYLRARRTLRRVVH